MEVAGDAAIDSEVLGAEPEYSDVPKFVETVILDHNQGSADIFDSSMFAGYGGGGFSDDMEYKRVQIPYEPVGEDIKAFMLVKLMGLFTSYRIPKPMDTQDVYEAACLEACENFINPTHAIKLNPKTVVAVDIEEIIVKVIDDHGTIKMAIYSNKPAMLKATESIDELDF